MLRYLGRNRKTWYHEFIPYLTTVKVATTRPLSSVSFNFIQFLPTKRVFCRSFLDATLSKHIIAVRVQHSTSALDGTHTPEISADLDFDSDLEVTSLEVGNDDESHHLLTILYPDNQDPVLSKILEATTINHVFTALESGLTQDAWTPEQCSQALATLWDLHKLMFHAGSIFNPSLNLSNRKEVVEKLTQNSTFQKILSCVINNAEKLQDEPIAACLLSLWKFEFKIVSEPCQVLLSELGKRKATLPLPAISRICVVLRNEGIYGALFTIELFPRLAHLITIMDDGHDLRQISIALRNTSRCLTASLIQSYYDRVHALLCNGSHQDIDPSIYCKILLCINDTKWSLRHSDSPEHTSPHDLARLVGQLLAPKVKDLPFVDLLSLKRVLEYSALEPPELFDSVNARIGREIELQMETPPLEVFSCITPNTRRTLAQRKRFASFVQDYLEHHPHFWRTYNDLLRVTRVLKLNVPNDSERVYIRFWDKTTQLLSLLSDDPAKVIKVTSDYFSSASFVGYRNLHFESKAKQLLHFYIDNYRHQQLPTFTTPTEFAKAYAFLLAYSWQAEPIYQEISNGLWRLFQENFMKLIRPIEIITMARGITTSLNNQSRNCRSRSTSRYFDQIQNFSASLDDAVDRLVFREQWEDISVPELVQLVKAQLAMKKASAESLSFKTTLDLISERATISYFDSKEGKDLAQTLATSNYNHPTISTFFLNFINKHGTSISPEFAQRFLSYGYNVGMEPQNAEEHLAFQTLSGVISKHWDTLSTFSLIQSSMMLSLVQYLQPTLVQDLFSIHFLNRLDEDCRSTTSQHSSFPMKLRKAYMELNRTVCLDLPNANVPWFHQKFCETVHVAGDPSSRENPLEQEVMTALREVLNDETAIQTNVVSPYFYNMDFVIEFDENGKPLKMDTSSRKLLSLRNFRKGTIDEPKVAQTVGILILPDNAFTTNVRSLRGYYRLRKRHLEILGYRVIQIDPKYWNSMHMTDLGRADFLENAIFPKPTSNTTLTLPLNAELNFDLI